MSDRNADKPKSVAEREARLAKALRENLRRRKEQARGRTSAEPADGAASGEGGKGNRRRGGVGN